MKGFSYFTYQENQLFAEELSLLQIAQRLGTPCYVYSQAALQNNYQSFVAALKDAFTNHFPHPEIHYAVKANSNLAVLQCLAKLGAGFDIVSGGELARVLKAGGDPKKILFSGVGKTTQELEMALHHQIRCINVESSAEFYRLCEITQRKNCSANIAFRVNPDVDVESHPYISTGQKENKFGIDFSDAKKLLQELKKFPTLHCSGLAFHIGSQMLRLEPIVEALEKTLAFIDDLSKTGITISELNVGGGLGICYGKEKPPTIAEYIKTIANTIKNRNIQLHFEPGRFLVGDTGVLLTRLEYIKAIPRTEPQKYFAIVDAAMNDFLRPALYQASHEILPVINRKGSFAYYDIVGPVCETSDFLGKNRKLCLETGDYLAILSAGAYGFSMSSNYNSRPRPIEVMVDQGKFHVVREREEVSDLFKKEHLL